MRREESSAGDAQPSPPGGVRLPSLAISDALRATFDLYRRHFWTFVLATSFLAIPVTLVEPLAELLSLAVWPAEPDSVSTSRVGKVLWDIGRDAAFMIMKAPLAAVLWSLLAGPVIVIAASRSLGTHIGVGAAYRQVLRQFRPLFLADLLLNVGMIVLLFTCLGVLALPYILPALEFIQQTVLLERRGPIAAFRRSWQLAEGHRWRIILCGLPITVIFLLLISGPVYLLHWWTGVSHDNPLVAVGGLTSVDSLTWTVWFVDQAIYAIGAIVFWPLYYIQVTILYLDLRAREAPYRLPTRAPASASD